MSCVLLPSLVLSHSGIGPAGPPEESSVAPVEIKASPLEALGFRCEQSQ